MQRRSIWIIAIVMGGLLLATTASAQQGGPWKWKGSQGGGWGPGGHYGRTYNPQTVETISGEVVKVERMAPRRGMSGGVHVLVQTATETVPVHLGPRWFLENQEMALAQKERISVSKSPFCPAPPRVARARDGMLGAKAPGTTGNSNRRTRRIVYSTSR